MAEASDKPAPQGERLAKVIARAGLCSRRDAEKWIADGRVSVDGKIVDTPAVNITDKQTILIDGAPLAARHGTRLWVYHKPAGLVVTEKDPEGRETIFEKLEAEGLPRVLTVGRLDINTEGLLLLTNDGGLKRVLELPSTGWLRKYRVRAFGSIDQAKLDTLKQGLTVDGISYGPIEATLERVQGGNVWLLVALREGKNREVKNVLGALGLTVNRLIRVSYGPFQLGDLAIGAVSLVKAKVLRDQLGEKLAREAGVDFDSAFPEEGGPDRAQKGTKSHRDPNARLRARPERPAKKAAAPKPRTGEPRFAKQRAEGKAPLPVKGGRTFREDKPATRRVLFDDGRELVEEAPRPRRDKPFDDQGREDRGGARGDRDFAPRGRAPAEGKSFRDRSDRPARTDRPERSGGGNRKSFGDRPSGPRGDRPERSGGGDRKGFAGRSSGPREDRPGDRPRSGGRPGFGGKPGSGRPNGGGRAGGGGKPAAGGRPSRGPGNPSGRGPGKPSGPRGKGPRS